MVVPCKKHGRDHGIGVGSADALRPDKANDTPAPTINFEAARKLRRDLITVMFLDDVACPFCVAW